MASLGFSGQNLTFQGLTAGSAESALIRGLDGKSISLGTSTGADFGTDVVYLGYRAGFGNVGGANCTFIGNNVAADGASGGIFDCVLIGEESARYAQPTADSNVALGNHTLTYVSTGHQNTAIGDSSMKDVSQGSLNAAFGVQTLQECGVGSGNVAIGAYAGMYQAGVANSVFVGYQAGQGASSSNAGGEWNTALGTRAGYTFGPNCGFNSLVGGESGFHTVSSSNTAFGFRSLYEQSPVSAGGIVAIGIEAARGMSGGNSVAIGNLAGKGGAGSECIFIGNRMGVSNANDLSFAVGMSSATKARAPLLEGNLDTSNAPYLAARGAIKVKQKALNATDMDEDGVVVTGQDGTAWQMIVLNDGSCMLRQNGQPICVFTA